MDSKFLEISLSLVERLYICNKDSGQALKLLPLVQVGASPQSARHACYFFNRLERDGASEQIACDARNSYHSWEHCYTFFASHPTNFDLASLHLAVYPASWGM
jgi:hypothetical protein